MPDCRMGAVIMKMIKRTRTTSMNGTMLMSERDVCVDLASWGMVGLSSVAVGDTDIGYQRPDIRKQERTNAEFAEDTEIAEIGNPGGLAYGAHVR